MRNPVSPGEPENLITLQLITGISVCLKDLFSNGPLTEQQVAERGLILQLRPATAQPLMTN